MKELSSNKKRIINDIESELFNKYDNLKVHILFDIINNNTYRSDLSKIGEVWMQSAGVGNGDAKNPDEEIRKRKIEKKITDYIINICNDKYKTLFNSPPGPDPDFIDFIRRSTKNGESAPFFDETEGRFVFDVDKFPVVLNIHEQEFVKLMLDDVEARCFMSDELLEKLEERVRHVDISHISDHYTTLFQKKQNYDYSELKERIAIVLTAIDEHRGIKNVYRTAKGERKEALLCPYKILYSLRNDSFKVISWYEDEERVICQNIERYKSLTIADKFEANKFEKIKEFIENKKCFVTLTISEKEDKERKAFERCILTFADYEREVYYKDGKDERSKEGGECEKDGGKYIIFLYYFDFDKNELVDDIVALGSAVLVESCDDEKINQQVSIKGVDKTEEIRCSVIRKIKASLKNFEVFD